MGRESKRRRRVVFLALCLGLLLVMGRAQAEVVDRTGINLDAELGLSQNGHGYVRPLVRYYFPVGSSRLFAETIYEQRLNERLEGSVDFWLRGGLLAPVARGCEVEFSLNHLCRHGLSTLTPFVLSVNEVIGRLWWTGSGARLGFGLGTYFKTSPSIFDTERSVHGLAAANLAWDDILGSIFSLRLEFKLVDFEEVLHDVELQARLGWGAYLFVKNVTTYGFPNMTDFGLGFGSDKAEQTDVNFVSSEAQALPSDTSHKLIVDHRVILDLARSAENRFLLEVEAYLPILRGKEFLGLFRPEKLRYPLKFEYEHRLGSGAFLFGYGSYEVSMPVDVARRFSTDLGLGLGLRNQHIFKVLDKPFRYEVSIGLNSPHNYDARLSLGANTIGRSADLGVEAFARSNGDAQQASFLAFAEFGKGTRIRLFVGGDWLRDLRPVTNDQTRFWVGFGFYRLIRSDF